MNNTQQIHEIVEKKNPHTEIRTSIFNRQRYTYVSFMEICLICINFFQIWANLRRPVIRVHRATVKNAVSCLYCAEIQSVGLFDLKDIKVDSELRYRNDWEYANILKFEAERKCRFVPMLEWCVRTQFEIEKRYRYVYDWFIKFITMFDN